MKKICKCCGKIKEMISRENTCFECRKEEALEKMQTAIREAEPDEKVDTWSDDYVICPYCGSAMETNLGHEDFPEIYEAGDHELECEECGKTFILNTHVSYSWETEGKKDGDGNG